MKLYKGVFKGGGFNPPPPPKKNSDLFLKSEGKGAERKIKKMKKDVKGEGITC